jgi:hypothetical protein
VRDSSVLTHTLSLSPLSPLSPLHTPSTLPLNALNAHFTTTSKIEPYFRFITVDNILDRTYRSVALSRLHSTSTYKELGEGFQKMLLPIKSITNTGSNSNKMTKNKKNKKKKKNQKALGGTLDGNPAEYRLKDPVLQITTKNWMDMTKEKHATTLVVLFDTR